MPDIQDKVIFVPGAASGSGGRLDRCASTARHNRAHAISRLRQPEEIAALVAARRSDRDSFIFGGCYPVDSGHLAQ